MAVRRNKKYEQKFYDKEWKECGIEKWL